MATERPCAKKIIFSYSLFTTFCRQFEMTLQNKVQIYILTLLWTTTMITQALTPSWPNPYWNIPGDYCRAKYEKMNCCNGRQDPCSVEILGTLCYCDTFCNRTDNSDCCPDYFTHCAGLQEPEPLTVTTYPPQSGKSTVGNNMKKVQFFRAVTLFDSKAKINNFRREIE